jgi:hypothetical protein
MNLTSKKLLIILGIIFLCPFLASASTSPDAIGLRVMPNEEHYSAYRWYSQQGFDGSPQSITVDGYEAVRDGRTVYVNAANVSATSDLYTNIYIISYNQSAESATTDIFGQILAHWKFNTNLIEPGVCSQSADVICLADADCPVSEYCLSQKAETIRDTRRLSDLAEISIALENYKATHGYYPKLESGSYLPHQTLSTWPSWQDNLAQELGVVLPVDPVNKLGSCAGYDETTCWNDDTKEFAGSIPNDLPEGSQVYVYSTDSGSLLTMGVCSIMESGLVTNLDEGACANSAIQQIFTTDNNPPQFTGANLPNAHSGFAYAKAYIEAADPDGDYLSWSIEPAANCDNWENIRLENTPIASQKEIKADLAGNAGDCQVVITIDDNEENGEVSKSYYIRTINDNVPIIANPGNQEVIIGHNFDLTITASEADNQYPLTFAATGLPNGLTGQVTNQHDYRIAGVPLDQTKDYTITLTAQDKYQGQSAPMNFTITVVNNPPEITTETLAQATACIAYEQTLAAIDPDGHTIDAYAADNLPNNLNITNNLISGTPQAPGQYQINIIAQDQFYNQTIAPYSAEGTRTLTLEVGDEQFTVNQINDAMIYVYPENATLPLYYGPTQFNHTATVSGTANTVVYSLANNPAWLTINPHTGVIQGTPTDNTNDPGSYTITVKATNPCGATAQTIFTLTVGANEWCGDGFITNNEQCEAKGNGTSADDQYECNVCQWFGGWCGDATCDGGYDEGCDICVADCGVCCVDECFAGTTRCLSSSVEQNCADHNSDGCTEWGGNKTCSDVCYATVNKCVVRTTYSPACYEGKGIEYCNTSQANAFCVYKSENGLYNNSYTIGGWPGDGPCGSCDVFWNGSVWKSIDCNNYGFGHCIDITCYSIIP